MFVYVVACRRRHVVVKPVQHAVDLLEFTHDVEFLKAVFLDSLTEVFWFLAVDYDQGDAIRSLFPQVLKIIPESAIVHTMIHAPKTVMNQKYLLAFDKIPVESFPVHVVAAECPEAAPIGELVVRYVFSERLSGGGRPSFENCSRKIK